MNNNDHYAIILCGGSGTRLWPFSRSNKPKQFLKFNSALTLFQKTIKRVSLLVAKQNIYIVTKIIGRTSWAATRNIQVISY